MFRLIFALLLIAWMADWQPCFAAENDALSTGISYFSKGEYVKALQELGVAQKSPGALPRALYYRALVEFKLGKSKEAADTLRALVSLAPVSPEAALAQDYLHNLDKPGRADLTEVASLPKHAKIPFRVARDDSMHVDGVINGRVVDMIWDTGATNCSLPAAVAGVPADSKRIAVETPNGLQTAYKGMVEIGAGDFRRKAATTIMEGQAVIGQSFFQDYKVEFNKDLRYIYLDYVGTASGAKSKAASKFQVPFERESGIMVVDVTVDDRPIKAYFDTGCAASGIAMSSNLVRSIGNPMRVQVAIGPIVRKNVAVTVANGMSRPLIGPAVFGDRRYKIDPVNQVIDFDYSRE